MSPLGVCAATLLGTVFTGPEGLYSRARGCSIELQRRSLDVTHGGMRWHSSRCLHMTEDGAPIRRTEEAALLRLDTAGDAASTRWNPAYAYDDAAAGRSQVCCLGS